MVNKCYFARRVRVSDTPKAYYLLPRNGKYSLPLREGCSMHGPFLSLFLSLSLCLSLSFYLTYLSHAINNSACGRFLWLRNEERTLAPALERVCLPARPPMYCTTPNGIAPSRCGRIARYNGPLHNGIRTCDIPGGCRRDAAHDTGVAKEACLPVSSPGHLWGLHHVEFLIWHDSRPLRLLFLLVATTLNGKREINSFLAIYITN